MRILEEDDLKTVRDEGGFSNACPECLTDAHLMDLPAELKFLSDGTLDKWNTIVAIRDKSVDDFVIKQATLLLMQRNTASGKRIEDEMLNFIQDTTGIKLLK